MDAAGLPPTWLRRALTLVILLLCAPAVLGALILGVMVAVALSGNVWLGNAVRAASARVGGVEVYAFGASAYGGEFVLLAALLAGGFLWAGARPTEKWLVLGSVGLGLLATAVFWLYLEPRVGVP